LRTESRQSDQSWVGEKGLTQGRIKSGTGKAPAGAYPLALNIGREEGLHLKKKPERSTGTGRERKGIKIQH